MSFSVIEGDVTLRKSDGTETGVAATPLRTDPTGTTAQPVTDNGGSLTVDGPLTDAELRASAVPVSAASLPLPAGAATEATLALIKAKTDNLDVALSTRAVTGLTDAQLRATAVPISAASLPLPAGAATETTLASRLSKADFEARINTLGQKTMANGTPVVIASDQSAVAVKSAAAAQVDGHSVSIGATTDADTALTVIGRLKQLVTKLAGGLPAALVGGRLDTNAGAWMGSTAPTVGQKAMAASIPVTLASDQPIVPTKEVRTATPVLSNVTASTSTVTLLAANAARLGATLYNDGTKDLWVKFGAAASQTSFTVKMVKDAYYEVPYGYTGTLTGVWDTGVSGAARVTELT